MTGTAHSVIVGTLAEPLEILQTKNGKPWVKAVVEVKSYRRGADGEAGQEETTLIPVNLFFKPAEIAQKFLQVGDPLVVQVRLSGTEFQGQGGKVRRGVTLALEQLHLIPNGRRPASPQKRKEEVPPNAEWL